MADTKTKAHRRPPKHEAERLRGRIAMRILMLAARVDTANGLAKVLAPNLLSDPDEMEKFNRTCRRYVAGAVAPGKSLVTKLADNGGGELVTILERCLNSPVWEVLRGKAVRDWAVLEALHNSPSNIGAALFEPGDGTHLLDTRLREFDEHIITALKELTGFDAVEALVLLSAYARSIQSQPFINAITYLYMEQRAVFSEHPELRPDFRELFTEMDRQMMVRTFLSMTRKMDGHFPWEGHLPDKAIPDPNRKPSLVELAEMPIDPKDLQAGK